MEDAQGGRTSVIVLGAAFRDGRHGPSPALVRRARHGARLTLAGPQRILVAVGGGPAREAVAIAAVASAEGVSPGSILGEGRSRNTLQNAALTARLLGRHGLDAGYLVTDWPHMPRAWLCFRVAGLRCRPAPVPGTAGKPVFWLRELVACAACFGGLPRLYRTGRRLRRRLRPEPGS